MIYNFLYYLMIFPMMLYLTVWPCFHFEYIYFIAIVLYISNIFNYTISNILLQLYFIYLFILDTMLMG